MGGKAGACVIPCSTRLCDAWLLRRQPASATLVASGDQIPFDVAEQAGPDEAFFHSYVPLTARFVREREAELRSLPAFEPARNSVALAGVAAPYLEQRGETVAADPGERAAHMLTVFMASLWDGCTEFSLDRDRLESALAVLDAEAGDVDEADIVVVPLVGLQMPLARLQLPHGMQLVRADSFEAPIEAMRSEGMGRAAWEPQFLAIAEQGREPTAPPRRCSSWASLISVMRLFKAGGVGLGPHAFAPTGEGRWRRIATGAPAPRADGYKLNEEEAAQLVELAETLEARPDPAGPLAWAVRRFELGCERPSPAGRTQRPSSGAARRARRSGPGRRFAADARRGADRRWLDRPARRPRAGRSRAGAGARTDVRRLRRERHRAGRLGQRSACAGSSAKPLWVSSAPTSTRRPTRP